MGSLNPENEPNQNLNDSGYVQDEAAAKETSSAEEPIKSTPSLLDLSDDVLLYILKYLSPYDLKALGFTCPRLGTLILDRTLWLNVDARDLPTGKNRMRWLLTHALSVHTTSLMLSGFAREAKGCLGFMSGSRDEVRLQAALTGTPEESESSTEPDSEMFEDDILGPRLMRLSAQALPRYGGGFPFWPEQLPRPTATYRPRDVMKPEHTGHLCPGPQVTLTSAALCKLTALCCNLTELSLDYVVIDCNMTKICMFPLTLRKLSLRGTKCFNLEKSFLYKIQDRLVKLEELDLSFCEWIEPACMLPLSKMPQLFCLIMQECPKLSEFVAYASLATRYGFKTLRILDLRGSPVGDSEVSALGWLPSLEQLFLAPAPSAPRHADHAHFSRDPPPPFAELHDWEATEPEYYKSKYPSEQWIREERNNRPNRNPPADDNAIGSCVLLQHMIAEPPLPPPNRVRSRENVRPGERDVYTREYLRDNRAQLSRGEHLIAEERRERARERQEARARASMGYIISNNGCIRRTINMYPDTEMEPENPSTSNDSESNQDASNKRKQNDEENGTPTKRQRDRSVQTSNEQETSDKQSSVVNEPGTSSNEPGPSSNEPGPSSNEPAPLSGEPAPTRNESGPSSSEPGPTRNDSGPSRNEPGPLVNGVSCSKEPCATKASLKYYDDAANCQVSRALLKDSLNDFKKRTEDSYGPIYKPPRDDDPKPDFVDSDDDPSNMDNDEDDDDDDDDKPQPKRSRVVINDGASTSRSDSQNAGSHRFYLSVSSLPSQPQPSCSTTEPRRSMAEPRNFANEPSLNPPTAAEIKDTLNQFILSDLIPIHSELPFDMMNVNDILGEPSEPNEPSQPSPSHREPNESSPSNKEPGGPSTSKGNNGQSGEPPKFVRFTLDAPPVVVEDYAAIYNYNNNFNMYNNNDAQEPDWNNRFLGRRDSMISGLTPNLNELLEMGPRFPNGPVAAEAGAAGNAANAANVVNGGNAANAVNGGNAAEPNVPEGNAVYNELRRHRILYVNVGRRRHAMYQISMPEPVDLTRRPTTTYMNLIYSSQVAPRLEYTSLVTDAAIRRFGRADGDNINYVQIGPMGPMPAPYDDPHARPNRSNLRVLSVTGFRHITNYSLTHLATAAPYLQSIDFTGTRVTESGVEHFRNFRPDCRVRYGSFETPKEDSGRPHSR